MKARLGATVLAIAWLALAGQAFAGEAATPREWLSRMSAAMSQMDYQGTFVYLQDDDVVTMRITHVAGEDGIRERLVSVSGAAHEVLRDASGVRWVLGDDHSVLADEALSRSFFPRLPPDQGGQAERCYSLSLGSSGRVAGHAVRSLSVLPRDDYRYGYVLWLEKHSALPLKWELIDRDRKALAKLVFTDFRMGSEVDPAELLPSSQLQNFKTVESGLPAGRGQSGSTPRWRPGSLPPGFELTAHRNSGQQGHDLFEHLVYSDGLAAVSVYVESDGAHAEGKAGIRRMGTTHAFSRLSDGVLITVIGDVPATTVRLIGDTVVAASP